MRRTSRWAALPALILILLAILPYTSRAADPAPNPGAWSAAGGADPCGSEALLERQLAADPALRQRREVLEALIQEIQRQGLAPRGRVTPGSAATTPPTFVIPVVVHLVHQGGPENLSDLQVKSQIYALNRDFANLAAHGLPAVNTGIQFCLAQNLPAGSPVSWSTTPGITRTNSPETNTTWGSFASETALKAVDFLPSDRYLNIWVVKTISGGGGGIAGWGTFPGTVAPNLDGIVMRYDVFGSNSTPFGSGYTLLASNADGKILAHEAGHYLDLYHPFHNGCTPPGDQVADTPPEAVNRVGCPVGALTSCTAANDPIENFMDYTNDGCRWAFTAGQTARMQAAITASRSLLVSGGNLIAAGCSSGLNALITASSTQICAGDTVRFSTPAAGTGYTYAWQFPGGVPSSASTQTVTVTYPAAGTQSAVLTVTDGGPNYSTNSRQVYVTACTSILGPCTNWVFGNGCALSFATGAPVAFGGTLNASAEPATSVSSPSGSLLFYADGNRVYNDTSGVMPNGSGLLAGTSSHNGVLAARRPGSATQYFLFTIRQWEDGLNANPVNYSVIDMTLNSGKGDIVAGQKNLLVSLPGSPTIMLEGQTLIPHCNGTDWWYITHGAGTTSGEIFVTLVTSAGPGATNSYSIGMSTPNVPAGSITPSRDGTRIAMANLASKQIAAYNFDRATGVVTTLLAPMAVQAWTDIALSPNNKLLYYSWYSGTNYGVRQLDLATLQTREVDSNAICYIKPGPDGRIYLGVNSSPAIHCINSPDNFNTLNANECGLNRLSVAMPVGKFDTQYGSLPNLPLQCTGGAQPAQFTTTVTNCLNVSFHAVNCAGPYSWSFGDLTYGSGQDVSHVYSSQGSYTVTLTVPGASPSVASQVLNLQPAPVIIAGPTTACFNPSNYSAVGPSGYSYQWTVTGGTPATATGNNVDVTWGPAGGSVSLLVTDPVTGCTSNQALNVVPCPVCVTPPLNMVGWWPLDEPSGATATDVAGGNTGADINAPVHGTAKVRLGRQFNGANQSIRINDAPGINFGTGDLTIDAWVKSSLATGIQMLVDKRIADPEQGYALYLKNGRLAFRLGDGTVASGTEYWSATTPLVANGQWHHVAAVERRSVPSIGTRLYVDGVAVASFPAFAGNINNSEKLLFGVSHPLAYPGSWLNGQLDEVEFFNRSLGNSEILGLFQADSAGKCKEFCHVPSRGVICSNKTSVTLGLTLCNYTAAPQTYSVNFSGLPAGPGCTYPGPTSITLLGTNPVGVPANSCVTVQFVVNKPAGMPQLASSCYQVVNTNINTGKADTCVGSVYTESVACGKVIGVGVDVGIGLGAVSQARYSVSNTSLQPATIPYTVHVSPAMQSSEPTAVGLNGFDPGVPVSGVLNLAPGDSVEILVAARFSAPRSFRFYDVVLSLDTDGDGQPNGECSMGLTYRESAGNTVVIAPPGNSPTRMDASPNPFRRGTSVRLSLSAAAQARVAVYDVAGRLVRSLHEGRLEAGDHRFAWDGRDASGSRTGGVFFVRADLGHSQLNAKIVQLR